MTTSENKAIIAKWEARTGGEISLVGWAKLCNRMRFSQGKKDHHCKERYVVVIKL